MKKLNTKKMGQESQLFHLVDSSRCPFFIAWALFMVILGVLMRLGELAGVTLPYFSRHYDDMFFLLLVLSQWLISVLVEGSTAGYHGHNVGWGIRLGMLLFIASEMMFFFSFFWVVFHFGLGSTDFPPKGCKLVSPHGLPLLNTLLLLTSGMTVTCAHKSIKAGCSLGNANLKDKGSVSLYMTMKLGFFFLLLQWEEYCVSGISMNDGVFGSTFYLLTGFHGFHVLLGVMFLMVCWLRLFASSRGNTTTKQSLIPYKSDSSLQRYLVGLDCAVWYWHFVDVVWLFLFIVFYVWLGDCSRDMSLDWW